MMVSCKDLKKSFIIRRGYLREEAGRVQALRGISLDVATGISYGIVGESGSGKSTLGRLILGLIKADSGSYILKSKNSQMIFQDPYNSLDPRMNVRDILKEGLIIKNDTANLNERLKETLEMMMLTPEDLKKYPHQFSGGQRQRIAIGRALITRPDFLVCDECVSGLDITTQFQILSFLKDMRKSLNMTYLFISHDLRAVRFMCDHVAVMREGRIVEMGPVEKIYSSPETEYAKKLLSSVLDI